MIIFRLTSNFYGNESCNLMLAKSVVQTYNICITLLFKYSLFHLNIIFMDMYIRLYFTYIQHFRYNIAILIIECKTVPKFVKNRFSKRFQ